MTDRFREIRKHINSRSVRALSRTLPWPYNGMINDLLGCIQTGGNYLAAMGLASYTEMCGRQIFYNGNNKKDDSKCFNDFIEYMGAHEILEQKVQYQGKELKIKDAVRNGLVHRYFMKAGSGMVAMTSNKDEAVKTGFIIQKPDKVILVVIPYFNLFLKSLLKAKSEGILKWQNSAT